VRGFFPGDPVSEWGSRRVEGEFDMSGGNRRANLYPKRTTWKPGINPKAGSKPRESEKISSKSGNFAFIYKIYGYYINESRLMNAFHRPNLPATSKVLSLVRLHHGLPPEGGVILPKEAKSGSPLGRLWRSGARANHLQARRRRVALDDLPAGEFPVILELAGGSNFVIVHERCGKDGAEASFRVQFPDSREAEVRADRLRELYDGTCVFLSPGVPDHAAGLFVRLRRRLGWAC
jgi:hypothetical protein